MPKNDKFTSKKRRRPNTPWVNNALRSVGYMGKAAFTDLIPNISHAAKGTSEVAGNIAGKIKNANSGNLRNAISENTLVGIGKRTIDRTIQDLKSGKFYDPERQEEIIEKAMGLDMSDLDPSNWDFDDDLGTGEGDVNFTYVEGDSGAGSETTAKASLYIADTVKAGTEATIQASKANIEAMASIASTGLMQMQQTGNQIVGILGGIDNTLSSILHYHEENTTKFYETTVAMFEKFGKTIEEEKETLPDDKVRQDQIFSDGKLDFGHYKDYIKQRAKSAFGNTEIGSILGMFDSDSIKIIESELANPIHSIGKGIITKLIPEITKESLKSLDKTFKDFVPSVLARVGDLKNTQGNNFIDGVKRAIGEIFGLDPSVGKNFQLSGKVTKEAATFDKVTRNAIVEVLPRYARESTVYLRMIAQSMKIDTKKARESEDIYDYANNKYTSRKEMRKNIAQDLFTSQISGYQGTDFFQALRAGGNDLEGEASKRYQYMMNQMLAYITQEGKNLTAKDLDFDNKASVINSIFNDLESKDRHDKKAKGTLRETLKLMREKNIDINEITADQLRSKAAYNDILRRMSEDADEYGLIAAGLDEGTDVFKFIDEELGFGQRRRNEEERKKREEIIRRGSKSQRRKVKREERKKNRRREDRIALAGLQNGQLIDGEGRSNEVDLYESNGLMTAAVNAAGHMKNTMAAFMHGDSDRVIKEFSAIFTDSMKNLFNKFKESFITPAVESLFGKKNAEGYKEDGLLAGAQNSIKDTWRAVNLRLTGKGYIDSKGEKHTEASDGIDSVASIVKRTMKDIGESVRTRLFGSKDKDDGTKEGEKKSKGIVGGLVDNMKEGLVSWKNALFGTDDKDVKESVEDIKKHALDALPSASVGAVSGAVVGQMTGGLLGSLIGGPVTGAVLGVATSFLAKNEKFQRYIFGKEIEDENGKKTRIGGLVSQRTQEFFKDPENKKMVVGGAALGLAKSAILGSSGGYLGMLVGGPVAGMILGAGMGLLKKSKMFNTFLYGDEETGKTGIVQHIKNLWSKNSGTDENGKKSGAGATLLGALGLAGGGALLGSMIAKHGILGASLSAAGPIGGAILGLGLGIKLGGKRFQNLLFGEKDEEGKRKGGLFSKMANWMHVEVIAPMKSSLLDVGRFLKDEIEFKILEPLRISVEPLGKMFLNLGKKFMDRARSAAGKFGSNVKENLIKPFLTIAGNILSPLHTMVRTVSKVAVSASLAVIKMPVTLMKSLATIITNPVVQLGKAIIDNLVKPIKGVFGFARKAITAPFKALGKVLSFGAALSIRGANKLADRRAGLGRILGRDRYEDDGSYGSENARLRKEKRDRKRQRNQQRRIDQNLDYNRRQMARATGYELKYFTKENMEKVNEDIKEWNKTHKFKDRKQKIKWHGGENMTFDVDPEAERKKKLEKLGRVSNDGLIDRTGVGDDVDVRQLSETSKVRTILQNLASFFMGGVDPLKVKISELKQRRLNKKREEDGYTEPTEDEGNEPDGRTTMERYVDEMDAAGGVVNWFKKKLNDKFGRRSHLGGENDMSNVSQDEAMEQLRNDLNEEDTPNDNTKGIKGGWKAIKDFFGRHNHARAEGGPVNKGEPTLVGDGGKDPSAAEIIVPNSPGTVLSQKDNGIKVFLDGVSGKLFTQFKRTLREIIRNKGEGPTAKLVGFSEDTTEKIQDSWGEMDDSVRKAFNRHARKVAKKTGEKGTTAIGSAEELAIAKSKEERGKKESKEKKEEARAKLEAIQSKGSYLSQLAAKNEAKEKEENKNLLTQIAENTGEQAKTGKHSFREMISHFKEWGAMFGKTGKIALGLLVAIPIIKAAWPVIENILDWLKNFDLQNVLENVFKRFGFSMRNSGGTGNKKGDNADGETGTEALGDRLDDLANFAKNPSLDTASNILIDEHTGEISANAGPTLNGVRGLYQYGKKKLQQGEDILTLGRSRTKRREKRREQRKESWKNTKARTKKMTGWSKNQWKDIPKTNPEYWTNMYGEDLGMKKFNDYKMDKLNFAENVQEKGMSKRQAKAQMRKDQLKRKFSESKTGQKVQNIQKKGNKLLDAVDSKLPAKAGKGEKGVLDYALKKEGYTRSERAVQQKLMKSTTMGAKDTMVSLGISDDIAEKYVQQATAKQNNKLTTKLVTKVKNTKAGKAATEVAGKSKGLLQKFISMFKSAIDDFVEAVGKKLGGKVGSKGLKTGATKGLKGFVNGAVKIIEKKFPKIAGKVAAILGGTAAVASTGVGVLAVLGGNVAGAIMFGINEMSNPRSLFRVSADTEVDWIMTAIATTIGALKGTTAGAIFDLVFSLIEAWTESTFGVVPWTWIASTLYNLICNAIGDSASYDKLVENQQKFENDYEDYKEGEYQKQYKAYLKSSGQNEKSYSYDQYKQDVKDNKLTVSYSSKSDYNASTNKTIGRKLGDTVVSAGRGLKDTWHNLVGEKITGYLDREKNLFYQKDGDVYKMYNVTGYEKDGTPKDLEELEDKIHVNNLDVSKLEEVTIKKKPSITKAAKGLLDAGKSLVKKGKNFAISAVTQAGKNAVKTVETGAAFVKKASLTVAKGALGAADAVHGFFVAKKEEVLKNPSTKTYWKDDGNGKYFEYNANNQKMSDKSLNDGEIAKMIRDGVLVRDTLTVEESGLTKTVESVKKGWGSFTKGVSDLWGKATSALNTAKDWVGDRANDIGDAVKSKYEGAKDWLKKMGEDVWVNHDGSYYDSKGQYYTGNGEHIKEKDISKRNLQELISSGTVVKKANWQRKLGDKAKKAMDGVKKTLGGIWDTAKKAGGSLKDGLTKVAAAQKLAGDYIKEHGIGGAIKKFFVGGENNNKYGYFTPDGKGYYIRNKDGTYNHYSMGNDLIEENISGEDADRIDDNISKGVYKREQIKDSSVISSAIKSVQNTVEEGWKKAKDTVANAWSSFTSWLGGKGSDIELPESNSTTTGGNGGFGGFGDIKEYISKKISSSRREDHVSKNIKDYIDKNIKDSIGGYGQSNDHPYFSQADARWANKSYNGKGSKGKMKDAGCGPTAIAMVASKYKGTVTPDEVAKDAIDAGYRDKTGTNSKFVSYEASKLGIASKQKSSPTAEDIKATVDSGNSMILNGISNGEPNSPFTTAGHYVVAVGKDKNGNILINDPRGEQYNRAVAPEELAAQTRIGWNFRKGVKPKKKTNLKQKIKNLVGGFGKKKTGKKKGSGNNKFTAEDVIKIAQSEIGYLEKKSAANLDDKTANAGSANYTKFAGVAGHNNGLAWCATFVVYCFTKAANGDKGHAKEVLCGANTAACASNESAFKSAKRWTTDPQPGDIIFYTHSHTGIVVARNGDTIKTIEGNTSGGSNYERNGGCVAEKTRKINDPKIKGFGRPKFDGASDFNGDLSSGTDSSSSATASIDSTNGTDIFSKITNVFDQYVSKGTNGVLTGKWDYNYSDPSSTDTSSSTDNNCTDTYTGGSSNSALMRVFEDTWKEEMGHKGPGTIGAPLNDGAGKNYGAASFTQKYNIKGFTEWLKKKHPELGNQLKGAPGSSEYDASWKRLGKSASEAFLNSQIEYTFKSKVEPALKTIKSGSGVDLNNGTYSEGMFSILLSMANQRPAWAREKWVPYLKNHKKASSEDIINNIGGDIAKNYSGNYAGSIRNRYSRQVAHSLKMTQPFKYGNALFKVDDLGDSSEKKSNKKDTKKKNVNPHANESVTTGSKIPGGKGEEIGGYGAGATVMRGIGNMAKAASLKKTTNMLNSMEGNMNKEFTKIENSIDTKELGGYGSVKSKGQKATVEKRSVLRSTKSSSQQKEVMRKELETEKDVMDTLDSVKKEQSGVREKLDQICGFLQTIAGNTAGITPAIKQINLRGSVSERSTSQKNKAGKEMGVSGMESQAPSFGNSKNAKLAVELARG